MHPLLRRRFCVKAMDPAVINLLTGHPHPSLNLKKGDFVHAAAQLSGNVDKWNKALNYGSTKTTRDPILRSLADFLGRNGCGVILPSELTMASGVSGGIDMAAQCFGRRGEYAVVEEPTYFLAKNIF